MLPIPVAFLIYAAEALSFIFAVHLIFSGLADMRARQIEPRRSAGGEGGGGGGQLKVVAGNSKRAGAPSGGIPNTATQHPAKSAAATLAMLAGGGGHLARQPHYHLPEDAVRDLQEAADWFTRGGSPWRSIRDLARGFNVHHKTAGDYVRQAERRQASQLRTDRRRGGILNTWGGGLGGEYHPANA